MTAPAAVLVIDDERPMLEGLGKLLRNEGYRVHLAADGESGLRLLRDEQRAGRADRPPDAGPRRPRRAPARAGSRRRRRGDRAHRARLDRGRGGGHEARRLRLPHEAARHQPPAAPGRARRGAPGDGAALQERGGGDAGERDADGLGELLGTEGYRVHLAPNDETGLRLQREETVRVVLTDLRMPGLDGPTVLRHVRELGLDAEVIALTGHGSIEAAVAAMKQGVYDFLTKPPDADRLPHLVQRAAEPAARAGLHRRELRGHPRGAPRVGAARLRAGRLHGSGAAPLPEVGELRAGSST